MENMEHNHSPMPSEGHGNQAPQKVESKKNLMMALGAVAIILIVLAAGNFSGGLFNTKGGNKALSADEAKAKAEDFINKNLVQGTTASITAVEDYSDSLYKLKVKVGDTDIDSYITKDGKQFFPQAMDTEAAVASGDGEAQTPVAPADLVKSDKPEVELFVMSHCPYGTQAEKGIVPVMETLKDKANIKIKFVNYIMHQKIEMDDNLVQYCIDKEDNGKYTAFLKCFLKDGNSGACMTSTGVNTKKFKAVSQLLINNSKLPKLLMISQNGQTEASLHLQFMKLKMLSMVFRVPQLWLLTESKLILNAHQQLS